MSKRERIFITTFVAVALSSFLFLFAAQAWEFAHKRALCTRGTHLLYFKGPIAVHVLRTYEERALGLSGKESLQPDEGVVFDFGEVGKQYFWMKDMRFAIDIIFFDSEWRVVRMFPDARPESYPATFDAPSDTRYALEVTSGFALKHDLVVGAQMQLRSCEERYSKEER